MRRARGRDGEREQLEPTVRNKRMRGPHAAEDAEDPHAQHSDGRVTVVGADLLFLCGIHNVPQGWRRADDHHEPQIVGP